MVISDPVRDVILIRTDGDGAVLVTILCPIGRNGALNYSYQTAQFNRKK